MGGQVIHHHPDHLGLWIIHINYAAHVFGEVVACAVIGDRHVAPPPVSIDTDKQVYGAVATIFVVVAARLSLHCRDRLADFAISCVGLSSKQTNGRFASGASA
jgi:hypothetical protein